jgi:GT2 family glycosyltransferase
MKNVPKVVIIILNWNGKKDTTECLESMKQVKYPNYDVLLVDNGSTDDSAEFFRKHCPKIEVIETESNLGFTGGCNIGIRKAMSESADYILLLNNDVTVEPYFLDKLVSVATKNENIGILGTKINYYDAPKQIWAAGGFINYWICLVAYLGMNKPDTEKYSCEKDVDFVSGCSMLIKTNVFQKIGLLDERYFAYFEDVDICLTAKKNGYGIRYVPSAKIYHKVSRTSGGALSPFSIYYNTRNKLLFLRKHFKMPQIVSAFIVTMSVFCARTLYLLIFKRDIRACSMIFKGIKDAFTGNFGARI